MGTIFTGFTIIGLLLLIAGGIGLFFTYTHFALGSPGLIQGTITYGTFSGVGLTILVLLIVGGSAFE